MQDVQEKLDQAIQFHQGGKLYEAENLYMQISKAVPDNASILYFLGLLKYQKKEVNKSIEFFHNALLKNPDENTQKDIFNALADVYMGIKDYSKTIEYLEKSLEINPSDFTNSFNIAFSYSSIGNLDKAIEYYRKAIRLNPDEIIVHQNLLDIYKNLGNIDRIIDCFLELIRLEPKDPNHYFNVGLYYRKNNDIENAYRACINAVFLKPDFVEALINLSDIYFLLKDVKKAEEYILRAYEVNNNMLEIYIMLGNVYTELNEIDKVLKYSEEGLKKFPNYYGLLFNIARVKFISGELDEGWEYFKLRRHINENKSFKNFLLDYNGPLEDKTVLIYRDTGYGDTIQFARYVKLLAEKCKKVIFRPQTDMVNLMEGSNLDAQIITEYVDPESCAPYDFSINSTSLAYLFKTDIDNIHFKEGYLKADPELVKSYKEKYFNNNKLKVGIMWYALTHPSKNVSHINKFEELFKIDGIQFYSLQKGEYERQLKEVDYNIINLGETFSDFSDTAAAVENLDLLISVDTAAAHLGGAMGKKTWCLLPFVPNWRWFLDREDCPYYTSMKLFRQPTEGDWETVISKICNELKELV